ncbi:MAG: hypothetical protein Q4G69_12570 [Planctomycetia bacterium]|nr:hypothetical protein [Planctomycetia bacterium]
MKKRKMSSGTLPLPQDPDCPISFKSFLSETDKAGRGENTENPGKSK